MKLSENTQWRRIGFTLVELLVVIAIIAILVGLIVPAAMKVLSKGPQLDTSTEISALSTAIQTFQVEYKVNYIPSQIKLCERISDYGASQLDIDSRDYLLQLWPMMATKWQTLIDWNGDGAYSPPVVLEGDQCLVFFLGGIPLRNPFGGYGFATDQSDPVKLTQTSGRKGPYFEFKPNRIMPRLTPMATPGGQAGFLSYYDPYSGGDPTRDQPYAYFSGYGIKNYAKYGPSDCPTLGVSPYVQSATPLRFQSPNTHQIISAGANKAFGPGGLWTSANAGSIAPAGTDDQTNFYGSLMGISN